MNKPILASGNLRLKTARSVEEITEQLISALEDLDVEVCDEKEGVFRFRVPDPITYGLKYGRGYVLKRIHGGNIQIVSLRVAHFRIDYKIETVFSWPLSVFTAFIALFFFTGLFLIPLTGIFSSNPFWLMLFVAVILAILSSVGLLFYGRYEINRIFRNFLGNSLVKGLYATWPRTEFYAADKFFTFIMMIFAVSAYVFIINSLVYTLYTATGNELYWIGLLTISLLAPVFYSVLLLSAILWLSLTKSKHTPAFQRAVLKHKRYPKWMRKILEKWFALNQPKTV